MWAPKPDLTVLRGNYAEYATRLPVPADVALLVEVSDSTYHRDRGVKWRKYAAIGIPSYLIVRLRGPETTAEMYTSPTGQGNDARYAEVVRYRVRADESIPIELDGSLPGEIPLRDLLPA
jgi:hypothetical protein